MPHWIRFEHDDEIGFGTLHEHVVTAYRGNMFENPEPIPRTLPLSAVRLLAPAAPSKTIALWNNFHALAAKLGVPIPEEPLYLLKAESSLLAPGGTIQRPTSYTGRVTYEGELGIVIGKTCKDASEDEAQRCIFGYTCVNDVTAADLINKDPTFPQWARAKSFDGFGPFGPVIATDLDPDRLVVRTILNGQERQNYPIADMIFAPPSLVSRLSRDMTLLPGDLICCGTSLGVGTIKGPQSTVEVIIEGIGTLRNLFEG
ncbi:MAG: fumarylacetoacetate hydrolase [Rhodospirillales bacterium]|jgi:2-keto-4-pentenoate hydratase/2-oxohepta-3-ene-1,7-dioic acid hydratase in catechol pathway|nr:fumarylacetoacetate hydrolase [Rhodospirillales bacterium]